MDVRGNQVRNARLDNDPGVEQGNLAAGGLGLGQRVAGVGFIKEHLPLQVAGLDKVAVDQREAPNAGPGKQAGSSGSGCSAADQRNMRGGKFGLARGADAREQDLAGVAVCPLGVVGG